MNNKYLICIVGPTAIGKTSLSLALAKHFKTEIISADSRQFFREMSIGTAVPTKTEISEIPHHFIQHRSVEEPYSVGDFEREAFKKLEGLFITKQVVILVGGSGLYVNAVTQGLDYFPEVDPSIRASLNQEFNKKGIILLQQKLKELDPEYYAEVDKENPHRLIRALEICLGTKKPYSSFRRNKKKHRPFSPIFIGLTADREIIYNRINQRVDLMMEEGLLEEAKNLIPKRNLNALNTVGYKELFDFFDNTWTLDEAISEIKKNTRRFAKRQLTWFRKNKEITWFKAATPLSEITTFIEEKIN